MNICLCGCDVSFRHQVFHVTDGDKSRGLYVVVVNQATVSVYRINGLVIVLSFK